MLLILCTYSYSQKYDNYWLVGCCFEQGYRPWGSTNIFFTSGRVDTEYIHRPINFDRTSMSISDPYTGQLLFYSNGCDIYDANNKMLSNGENINPGENHDTWCEKYGYNVPKDGCFIPHPKLENVYYLFHRGFDYINNSYYVNKLYYSKIEKLNGKWTVTQKNVPLLDLQLFEKSFDVIKHANGSDWWILTYNYESNICYRFLLTKDTIEGPYTQYFPIPRGQYEWGANSIISPNGKIAVRIDLRSGLSVMDFNRESGELHNLRYTPFWITDLDSIQNLQVTGISISKNSRFLYISTPFQLWQMDLNSNEIDTSRILIDTFDGFASPFGTTFYLHQLAPDGKIYINCTNGEDYLHVINNPDLPGKACKFRQHDLKLPTYDAFTMPYFPNYRLGPIDKTDGSEIIETYLYPVPATNKIRISIPYRGKYLISNVLGQKLFETISDEIDIKDLVPGVYFLSVSSFNKIIKTLRFVKE